MLLLNQFTSTSKINLYLDIIGKDPVDGYHFIESIFYEIPWGDDFEIYSSNEDKVEFSGLDSETIPAENTVTKALRLFKEKYNIKKTYHIKIQKNVPMGAGLGGGSGNAGAILKWLAQRFNVNIEDCVDIAHQVGSDVPFFLYGNMALVEGKGEIITPLKSSLKKGMGLVVIYPNIHISTKEAFSIITEDHFISNKKSQKEIFLKKTCLGLDKLNKSVYNIFNDNLETLNQDLHKFKKCLECLLSPDIIMMTGSGSSFILFYQNTKKLHHTKKKIEQTILCSRNYIHSI